MSITIHEGSILDVEADALVNPANGHLNHAGGLARIIQEAAVGGIPTGRPSYAGLQGVGYREACNRWGQDHEDAPLLATGNAYLTSAGCLPFVGVIHAVGPIWNGGAFGEAALLALAHHRALRVAEDAGFKSIAFPAISCGIFGYPVELAAPIAVKMLSTTKLDVTVALMEAEHVAAYSRWLGTFNGRPTARTADWHSGSFGVV